MLFIGHTGGGKTTLVHWLATRRAELGQRVIVCDPDAAPGLWPGCEVYGHGNDFAAISRALKLVAQEVERRRKLRGSGQQRIFEPMHLVIDEYQDTATDCPIAKELVEDVLRRGRKLGIHLVIGVQDKLVKTMGFEGKGDLRKNFSYVIELRKDRNDQRWATLTASGDDEGITYPVPALPDPEKLIEQASVLSNLLTPNQQNERAVNGSQSHVIVPVIASENRAGNGFISAESLSAAEIAEIEQMMLTGNGKTETVKAMPRYSGRKHKEYVALYEMLYSKLQRDGLIASG